MDFFFVSLFLFVEGRFQIVYLNTIILFFIALEFQVIYIF